MKIYIHAAGGIGPNASCALDTPLTVDAEPVALRALVARHNAQSIRMASRFSELAMAGAARAAAALPTATRLYLGTALGDIVATDALYAQVMPPTSETVSPAIFVGSPNNMAAFFAARMLGLRSRNLTLSDGIFSFETALACARSDLLARATADAFVGGVDECTTPRSMFTQRFTLADSEPVSEGSGWLHLSARAEGAIGELLVVEPSASSLPTLDAPRVLRGIGVEERDALDYRSIAGSHPTSAALGVVMQFKRNRPATYLHLARDPSGRTGVIGFRVFE